MPICVTLTGLFWRKHPGLVQIYHSSCQKNLFSCNMDRLYAGRDREREKAGERRDLCSETSP